MMSMEDDIYERGDFARNDCCAINRWPILLFLAALSIFLIGCHDIDSGSPSVGGPKAGDTALAFEEAFERMLSIDEKYNASFYTEALDVENVYSTEDFYFFDWNRTTVPLDNIPPMRSELRALQEEFMSLEGFTEKQLIRDIIDARILMLESQEAYHLALMLYPMGRASIRYDCALQQKYSKGLSEKYNESVALGKNATRLLDSRLNSRQDILPPLLTGENRPKFYDSPFAPIMIFSDSNIRLVGRICR